MEKIDKMARKVLETPFWPEGMESGVDYFRTHDDYDGDLSQGIHVQFTCDGDAWILGDRVPRRFRTWGGGGASLRVRNALLLLALAIKLDNEEHPIGVDRG